MEEEEGELKADAVNGEEEEGAEEEEEKDLFIANAVNEAADSSRFHLASTSILTKPGTRKLARNNIVLRRVPHEPTVTNTVHFSEAELQGLFQIGFFYRILGSCCGPGTDRRRLGDCS